MRSVPHRTRPHHRWIFTPIFLAVMLTANLYFGVLHGELSKVDLAAFGVSLNSLEQGEWLRLITGSFISHDADMLVRQLMLAAFAIGWFEWRNGALRTFVMFFALDVFGTLFLMFGLIVFIGRLNFSDFAGLPNTYDVGMSAGGFGLIGASLYYLSWRKWAMTAGVMTLVLKAALFPEPIADLAHLMMLPTGFLAEALVSRALVKFAG